MTSLSSRRCIRSPEHLVPGAPPISSQRLHTPAGRHRPALNQAVEYGSSGQSAIISGLQPSAMPSENHTPATLLPSQIPIDGQLPTGFPRVPSSEAFGRRPLHYRVDRSCQAGIRNPSRKRPFRPTSGTGERRSITVIRRRYADRPHRQPVVARVDHGMIRPEGRSRRGPRMSSTPGSTLDDPQQIIADLKRQLAESNAERDEAQSAG